MSEVLDCGHEPTPDSGCGMGYGTSDDGKRSCYPCCADHERQSMTNTGLAVLYLSSDGKHVTDWPGVLRFPAHGLRKTRIGFCLDGRICYFTGPDGANWSARGPGLGMYARCRRLKS